MNGELIVSAVLTLKALLKPNPDAQTFMRPVDYLRQFRTIGINVPRRAGKTSAMEYLGNEEDLVFTRNKVTLDALKHTAAGLHGVAFVAEVKFFEVNTRGKSPADIFDIEQQVVIWLDDLTREQTEIVTRGLADWFDKRLPGYDFDNLVLIKLETA